MKTKRIHFVELNKSKWFLFWLLISILSLTCILMGMFNVNVFEDPKLNNRIGSVGSFLTSIVLFKMFFYDSYRYKYFAKWNKKWIYIKTKTFENETIKFEEIIGTRLEGKILTIVKRNGQKSQFDLNEVDESDIQKLIKIVNSNIIFKKSQIASPLINIY